MDKKLSLNAAYHIKSKFHDVKDLSSRRLVPSYTHQKHTCILHVLSGLHVFVSYAAHTNLGHFVDILSFPKSFL